MCILSYLPPEAPTDLEGLANGALSNQDGHGWAIAHDGKIIMHRSLFADEALTTFEQARRKYPGPSMFHSRWMTHGRITIANTHPFMVGEAKLVTVDAEGNQEWQPTGRLNHMTVVAHNGILPASAQPAKGDDRSDTRKFAEDILPTRFRKLDHRGTQKELATWCTRSNKLCILTVYPGHAASAYIVNQDAGEWDETTGIWHSNGDYREPFGRWSTHTFKVGDKGTSESATANVSKSAEESAKSFATARDLDWRCTLCGMGVVGKWGYCDVCGSCNDCYMTYRECECHSLAAATAGAS